MNISKSLITTILFISTVFLFSCSKEDNISTSGQVSIEITDAPIDNANVQGAFVTVADVRVDGASWSGFSGRQTINLLAYQNGRTQSLGNGSLDVGAYNQIELVLDYASDANGNAPGCYILHSDNTKTDLNSSSSAQGVVAINQSNFDVASGSSAQYVIDFDLRKAIQQGSGAKDYSFKTGAELNAALRSEMKSNSGTISGQVSGSTNISTADVVVYAYKKGTYTSTEASGNANTQFQSAVTSSKVDSQGNYTLSFLKAGEYDLVYCKYEDRDNDGRMELSGKLTADLTGLIDLQSTTVSSSTSVNVSFTASAIIGF